jgi:hypothetical protein
VVIAAQKGEIVAAVLCFLCEPFAWIYAIINFGERKLALVCLGGSIMFFALARALLSA